MIRLILLIICGYLLLGNPTARTQTANGLRNIADYIDPEEGMPKWQEQLNKLIGN